MGHAHTLTVAGVGIEPTDDHQALDLAALPVCVPGRLQLRIQESHLAAGLMRPGRALAHPHSLFSVRSDQGESCTPTPGKRHGVLSAACLLFHHLAISSSPYGS